MKDSKDQQGLNKKNHNRWFGAPVWEVWASVFWMPLNYAQDLRLWIDYMALGVLVILWFWYHEKAYKRHLNKHSCRERNIVFNPAVASSALPALLVHVVWPWKALFFFSKTHIFLDVAFWYLGMS